MQNNLNNVFFTIIKMIFYQLIPIWLRQELLLTDIDVFYMVVILNLFVESFTVKTISVSIVHDFLSQFCVTQFDGKRF